MLVDDRLCFSTFFVFVLLLGLPPKKSANPMQFVLLFALVLCSLPRSRRLPNHLHHNLPPSTPLLQLPPPATQRATQHAPITTTCNPPPSIHHAPITIAPTCTTTCNPTRPHYHGLQPTACTTTPILRLPAPAPTTCNPPSPY